MGHIDKSIDSMIETANISLKSIENLERLCTVFNQQNSKSKKQETLLN